jgi:hypothetical protein
MPFAYQIGSFANLPRGEDMLDTKQVSRLGVGNCYPETPPPMDSVSLTFGIASAADVRNGGDQLPDVHYHLEPTFKIWLNAPLTWEAQALKNLCLAYGLYAATDYPNGLPIFIFDGGNDSQFFVKAPLLADPKTVAQWIESGVSNGIRFYLMERQTGVIQTMRVIGMETSFWQAIKQVWAASLKTHPAALQRYSNLISTRSDQQLWNAARKWIFIDKLDSFIEA